ncbi:hypothetical protein COHA_007535 [Chlorella ohadii]|uniref:Potassium channel domain-containing protein n=1 Tax=Chlorella ohadii TaxID=2649997 RepID=A0AAD5DQR3_9CHLO|nr:hypothetical protein COHA_007535 [Chlorella ohadii]
MNTAAGSKTLGSRLCELLLLISGIYLSLCSCSCWPCPADTAGYSHTSLLLLQGCIWWSVAVGEGLDNSWAAAVNKDFDLLTASGPIQWLVSCYFALTTIVTVGYGDIVPVTEKEVAWTMAFQLVGVAMFAYLLNTASSLLAATGPEAKRRAAIRQKLEVCEVEGTMGALEFAPSLRRSIRRYFALAWEPPDGFVARLPQLYGDLPPALRHKLAAQQLRPVLRGLHFFPASMRSKEAAACCHVLAAFAHPLSLSPGQSLDGESAEGGGGSTGGGGNGGGSSSGGSTGGSGGGNGAGGSGGCTVDRPPAASKAMYILCTGRLVAECPTGSGDSGVQLPSPAVLGLVQLLAAAGGPLQAALSSLSPPGWQHSAVAATRCHLWRLDSVPLFAALKQQQPALLAHLARRLLDWLSDGSGMAAAVAAAGTGGAQQAQQEGGEAGGQQQQQQEQPEQQQEGRQRNSSAEQVSLLLKRLAADLEAAALSAAALDAHRSKAAGSKLLGLQRATAEASTRSGWDEGEEAEESDALQAVAEPAVAVARALGFVWGE